MRERLLLVFFGILLSITICAENPGTKPIYFTENRGQFRDQHGDANSDVLYIADFGGFKVQLRKNGFSYEIYQVKPKWVDPATIPYKILTLTENGDTIVTWPGQQEAMRNQIYHFHRIDVDFIGSNKSAIINTGRQGQKSKKILFPEENGKTATVQTYESISVTDVYPGIDIVYYAQNESGEFKYDFIVHPGADVSAIGLEYKGSGSIYLDETGKLNLDTRFGLITESIPLCYTENTKGERTIIEDVQFRLQDNMVYYQGTNYNKSEKLVIDPAVSLYWAITFGGDDSDGSAGSAVDQNGNAYLVGYTKSNQNIATAGTYQDSLLMEEDGFLAKFSRTGELQWSTYLNVSPAVDIDYKNDLVVLTRDRIMKFDTAGNFIWQISSMNGLKAIIQDNDENIIAVGDSIYNGWNNQWIWVEHHNDTIIKYNSQGVLQWSRGYGGTETYINDVGVDGFGNIYIAGITKDSTGIATPGSHLPEYNGTNYSFTGWYYWFRIPLMAGDGYFAKLDPNGQLIYGSYYGGHYFDVINNIKVADDGRFVIAGETNSRAGIATLGTHQDSLNRQGKICFQFIGIGFNFDCDNGGWPLIDTCIVGAYCMPPYDYRCQSTDAFIAKFNADGTRLWGTYYGNNLVDFNTHISANQSLDTILIVGNTGHACFNYPNDCPPHQLGTFYSHQYDRERFGEIYIAQFDATGNRQWGTYYSQRIENINGIGSFGPLWITSSVNQSKDELIVTGTSSQGDFIIPFNSFIDRFAVAAMDTIIFPKYLSVCLGDTVSMNVDVQSSINQEFLYTWTKNDSVIAHLNSATLSLPANFEDEGWYYYEIKAGNFKWVDSVYLAIRETPDFDLFKITNDSLTISNIRYIADINHDGTLDLIENQGIVYNNNMQFNQTDSLPFLYPNVSLLNLFGDKNPLFFNNQPNFFYSENQPNFEKPAIIVSFQDDSIKVIESDLLKGVTAWADFTNDGRPEGFKSFHTNQTGSFFKLVSVTSDSIYEKDAGVSNYLHWANCLRQTIPVDFDNDGDIDILFVGTNVSGCGWLRTVSLLENNNGYFSITNLPMLELNLHMQAKLFDMNADGKMDIVFSKSHYTSENGWGNKILQVFLSENDSYEIYYSDTLVFPWYQANLMLDPLVVDIDLDGYLDIVFGDQIYLKSENGYDKYPTAHGLAYTGLMEHIVGFGDFDRSGLMWLSGREGLYTSHPCNPPNTPPTAPDGLYTVVLNDTVRFYWQRATDLETPQMGLTYNLRVGTTPGGNNIMSSMSDSTGWRRIVGMGNVYQNTSWWLRDLAPATYYWSVQAIDNSFAGGPFAAEQTFTIPHSIPDDRVLENETITENQSVCFDAFETITVSNLLVQAGGNLELIAGGSILILPETNVEGGGIFRAWITSDSTFCTQPLSVVASEPKAKTPEKEEAEIPISPFFHLFPNPTNSTFTLELTDISNINSITVEIYSMMGERLLHRELAGSRQYVFDLGSRPAGVYLVRVIKDGEMGMGKVVKQ